MAPPRFKPCMQHQPMLFPPSVEELIPKGALVRVVDSIVDGIDRSILESAYPGGGAPAHDPAMMLKVVLFCYASGVYVAVNTISPKGDADIIPYQNGSEGVGYVFARGQEARRRAVHQV